MRKEDFQIAEIQYDLLDDHAARLEAMRMGFWERLCFCISYLFG